MGGCYGCGGIPIATPYPSPLAVQPLGVSAVAPVAPVGPVYQRPLGFGGVVDADPITPGIQSRPGVVTPIGPPRIAGPAIGAAGPYYGTRPF